jgi:hypothetical protein
MHFNAIWHVNTHHQILTSQHKLGLYFLPTPHFFQINAWKSSSTPILPIYKTDKVKTIKLKLNCKILNN